MNRHVSLPFLPRRKQNAGWNGGSMPDQLIGTKSLVFATYSDWLMWSDLIGRMRYRSQTKGNYSISLTFVPTISDSTIIYETDIFSGWYIYLHRTSRNQPSIPFLEFHSNHGSRRMNVGITKIIARDRWGSVLKNEVTLSVPMLELILLYTINQTVAFLSLKCVISFYFFRS